MKIDIVKVCAGLIIVLTLLMFSGVGTETTWRHSGFECWGYDINMSDLNISNVQYLDTNYISVGESPENLTKGCTVTVGITGAVDYLTTDYASDDIAIQTAIDDVSSSLNGKIVIREGVYTFANPVSINSNNIIFSGVQHTIFTATSTLNSFLIIGNSTYVTSVKISNIRFNCDNHSAHGIIVNGARDLIISNCEFIEPTAIGVHFESNIGPDNIHLCRISNCYFHKSPIAIHLQSGTVGICAGITLEKLYIHNVSNIGILLEDANKIFISDISISSNISYNAGIKIIAPGTAAGAYTNVYGNVISNYRFESHTTPYAIGVHLLTVSGGHQIKSTLISKSSYYHPQATGIKLEVESGGPTILHTGIMSFISNPLASNPDAINITSSDVKSTRISAYGSARDTLDACITDLGSYTVVNGIGAEAAGTDTAPTVADWEIGDIITNTDDNSIWIKDSNTVMRMLSNVAVGSFTAPSVPATTVNYQNPHNYPCQVQVYGGTVTEIDIDDIATGLTSGIFIIPSSGTINIAYSAVPSWRWWGL